MNLYLLFIAAIDDDPGYGTLGKRLSADSKDASQLISMILLKFQMNFV